jgi:2-oxoisovalerate dehydrogenase E1 component beta subunit
MPTVTLANALNSGLRAAMDADEKVVVMGEDVGRLGGVFRITDGLQAAFGESRVIDTPLAESAIVGTAIGLAMRGFRPVCEIQFDGFVYPAFDQIVSNLAKLHYRSAGRVRLPVTIRVPFGGGIGAVEHHSESPEAYFCHTAGLKVVACSNPFDAHIMIQQAIASDDPIVFLEPKRRYWEKDDLEPTPIGRLPPAEVPTLHSSRVVRAGTDATVVTYGPMLRTCLDAATIAEETEGRSLEVIDLRSLSPLDLDPVLASVRRTGRLVVVHEAPSTVSLSAEVAARVTERAFYSLEAPVLRVTGFDIPYPPSRVEEYYLPDVERILDAVDRLFAY